MSQVAVVEGTLHVHTGDSRIWAINVSAVTTSPSASGTVQIYDITAGGASASLVTSGSLTASGTNVILPTIGGTGWQAEHRYRVDATFSDGSGNTFVRSIFVQVDF